MPRPDLSSARAKLDRAEEHIRAMEEVGNRFLKKEPYLFEHEFKPYLWAYSIYVTPLEEPPPELSILAGEVLYNCGSALDHLICALARLANPTDECEKTQFPIFTTPKGYRDARGRYLRGVPLKAQTIIQRLQPYIGRITGVNPDAHVLEVFRGLYNTDKHRRLNVTLGAVEEAYYTPVQPRGMTIVEEPYAGPLRGKTKLVQFAVPRGYTGKVNVDADVTIGIGLDEGKPGAWPDNLLPSLGIGMQSIHYWISEEVLPKFDRTFDALP